MKCVRNLSQKLPILVLFLFFNCTNESFTEEKEVFQQSESLHTISVVFKEHIQTNMKLNTKMRSLSEFTYNSANENNYNTAYNFTINTDFAKFVESTNSNDHSYTFTVERDYLANSFVENLVFSYNETTDDYDSGLVTYHFTETQKQEYNASGHVSTPYEVSYISLDLHINDVFTENQLPCTTTYQEYHIPEGSTNSHLHTTNGYVNNACEHESDDDTPCTTYTEVTIYCPNSGSSTDGNATDDNTTTSSNNNSTNGGNTTTNNDDTNDTDTDDTDNVVTSILTREEVMQQSILECINGLASFNTIDTTVIDPEILNQLNYSLSEWIEINDFLQSNGCDEVSQEQIILQLLEQFDEQIFKDESFENNDCLNSVYTEMGKASKFNKYLKNFEPQFSVAHLRFSASTTMSDSINATTSSPENYLIKITFNANNLDRPKLSVARTFIHELIHAEIFRKLLSISQHPSIQLNQSQVIQLRNDYPGIYDYYTRWSWNVPEGQNPSDAQHEAMAQHYREIMENALREYDNTQTDDVYKALTWMGLQGTVAWNNLSQTEKNNINQTITNFYSNNPNCQ